MAAIHGFTGGGENGYGPELLSSSSGAWTYGAGWAYDGINNEIDYTTGGGTLSQSVSGDAGNYQIGFEITSSTAGGNVAMTLDNDPAGVTLGPYSAVGTYSAQVVAVNALSRVRLLVTGAGASIRPNVSVRRKY